MRRTVDARNLAIESTPMNYGLLRVDRDGKVDRVLIVDVADDQTALACARDFADNRAVEIWCGNRQGTFKTATSQAAASELGS